jgi:phosphoinositide-3-kinase regulatory subunit 4
VDDEGPPIDFCFRETGVSPLVVYATAFGGIVGLDLRTNSPAFRLDNDLLEGLQTTMAMSPDQSWMVSGTSSGVITCWDLRFQLPIVKCTHPAESRIRQLVISGSGEVLASVQGNNEVGLWNMESQFRQLVLWSSSSPLLSTNQSNSQSISAMHSVHNHEMNVLLTAGTDMRVRYWNLQSPEESYIVCGASNEKITPGNVTYRRVSHRHWKYHLFFDIISYHIICQKNDIISFISYP